MTDYFCQQFLKTRFGEDRLFPLTHGFQQNCICAILAVADLQICLHLALSFDDIVTECRNGYAGKRSNYRNRDHQFYKCKPFDFFIFFTSSRTSNYLSD